MVEMIPKTRRMFFMASAIMAASAMILTTATARAEIIGLTGPGSGVILSSAPTSVVDDDAAGGVAAFDQLGFNEQQCVKLISDLAVDISPGVGGGTIPAGPYVDSHMILHNQAGPTVPGATQQTDLNEWIFDGNVRGVMSDNFGAAEVASSSFLGASGTTYPTTSQQFRGMELTGTVPPGIDHYAVINPPSARLTVFTIVRQPGDWIRVITEASECIDINIKPDSDPNSINTCSGGNTPVAIFGSPDLDVTTIDVVNTTLASASVKTVGKSDRSLCSTEDIGAPGDPAVYFDGINPMPDGNLDLVCHYETMGLALDMSTTADLKIVACDDPSGGADSLRCEPGDLGYYEHTTSDTVKIVQDCS